MAVETLLGLAFAFLGTVATLHQVIMGTYRVERLLGSIHQRLVEIRDRR